MLRKVFNRKPETKTEEVTPVMQELHWHATVVKPDNYLALEWGKVRYNRETDTATLQYVTNNRDGTVTTSVTTNISVAEMLAELAKLRDRKTVREWNYTENTLQNNLKKAMEAVQVCGNFSVHPAK